MDQSLTSTISTMVSPATSNTISKLPVTSSAESLTNVYSIIMDDGMYNVHVAHVGTVCSIMHKLWNTFIVDTCKVSPFYIAGAVHSVLII